MLTCVLPGCKINSTYANIQLHRFPRDEFLRDQWIEFTGKQGWSPKQGSVICSIHLTDEVKHGKSGRLKRNAVPSYILTLQITQVYMICKIENDFTWKF